MLRFSAQSASAANPVTTQRDVGLPDKTATPLIEPNPPSTSTRRKTRSPWAAIVGSVPVCVLGVLLAVAPVASAQVTPTNGNTATHTRYDDGSTRSSAITDATSQVRAPVDLLADWRASTIKAAAHQSAVRKVMAEPQNLPILQAAVREIERKSGRTVTPRTREAIADKLFEAQIPPVEATFFASYNATATSQQATIDRVVREQSSRIPNLKDPFTPVAQGDPVARSKNPVLWEDRDVMVIVDTYSSSPKVLVIPKAAHSLPTELGAAELQRLASVAEQVSRAFSAISSSGPSQIWINPPIHLGVRQLHVHVHPGLPKWEPHGRPANQPEPAAVTARKTAFYDALKRELNGSRGIH